MKLLTSNIAVRYVISGGTGACVQIIGIYILHGIFGIWYLAASALAFLVALVISFTLHKFWTFKDKRPEIPKQFSIFFIVAIINLGLDVVVIYGLVDGLRVWYFVAQILTSATVGLWTFFLYRFFVFPKVGVADAHVSAGD